MATVSTNEMRKQIIAKYGNGAKWAQKVNKMPETQVVAFWHKLQKGADNGQK